MTIYEIAFWLIVSHAACDYPLQGDFLAKAKNHKAPLPGIDWQIALGMHAAIHAGGVLLATNSPRLASYEFVAHCLIDWAKCQGLIGFRTDQALHIACKAAWIGLLVYWGVA